MAEGPVTYVRHAMPVPVEGVHPTQWELDEEGRRAARELADRLEEGPGIAVLVTSAEPKALATAEEIGRRWGVEPRVDQRLVEVVRPWVGAGYRAVAHRYLRGEQPEGWEDDEQVAARVAAAVREATETAAGKGVVCVSHGLALSVHLGDRLGPGFDREQLWGALAFPDAWVLDERGLLHRAGARSSAASG